jgi:predicted ATP-grasp superfamily ATP-dependent carboligase
MVMNEARQKAVQTPHELAPVIVLGMTPLGMNLLRNFARRQIPVIGVDCHPEEIGFRCRAGKKVHVSSPEQMPRRVVEQLLRLARQSRQPPVLLPANDPFALFLAQWADELRNHFRFNIADAGLIERLSDKYALYDLLNSRGLPTPRTWQLDLANLPGDVPFPCIVKSRFSSRLRAGLKGLRIAGPEELANVCARVPARDAQLVLQEFIPGADDSHFSCAAYLDRRGRVLGVYTGHKLRQYPPGAGLGCLCESRHHPEVRALGLRVLEAVGYRGVGEVEIKRDARNGAWTVIEINARTWLQNELAARAGVDLDYLAYGDLTGRSELKQAPLRQIDGIRWLQVHWDVLSSMEKTFAGDLTLVGWLKSLRAVRVVAFWDPRDWLPFVIHLCMLARDLTSAFLKRARRLLPSQEKHAKVPGDSLTVPVGERSH